MIPNYIGIRYNFTDGFSFLMRNQYNYFTDIFQVNVFMWKTTFS